MPNAVCETEHEWKVNGRLKSLRFSQRCESASKCLPGWSSWPLPYMDPSKQKAIHTTCIAPECRQPAKPFKATIWIRLDLTYYPEYSERYTPRWWLLATALMRYIHQLMRPVSTFRSCRINDFKPGSVLSSIELEFNVPVSESVIRDIGVALMQGFTDPDRQFDFDGVTSRTSLLNVFNVGTDEIGEVVSINGSAFANITTWDANYFCQDEDQSPVCLNGGTCHNDVFGIVNCSCLSGYTGAYCQYGPPDTTADSSTGLLAGVAILLPITAAILILLLVMLCRQRLKKDEVRIRQEANAKYTMRTRGPLFAPVTIAYAPSYRTPFRSRGEWDPTDAFGLATLHRDNDQRENNQANINDSSFWRPNYDLGNNARPVYRNPTILNQNVRSFGLFDAQKDVYTRGSNTNTLTGRNRLNILSGQGRF